MWLESLSAVVKEWMKEHKRTNACDSIPNEAFMNEEQIIAVRNARRDALKEAAQAICPFCRDGNPWTDAQCVDGMIYEHFQQTDSSNKRPCAATPIWKLRYAE